MKEQILKLREEGKTYNEISKELGCAKSTISYHCSKAGMSTLNEIVILSDSDINNIKELYEGCITKKSLSEKFNVSEYEISKYTKGLERYSRFGKDLTRKQKQVILVTERRRRLKEMAVEYKGGECSKCGYNKCVNALEFHHLDPNEKDFGIGTNGHTRSWKRTRIELDKCIMVCANCHREIHDEINKRLSGEKESQMTVNH